MSFFIISLSFPKTSGRAWLHLHSSAVYFLPDAHHQRELWGKGIGGWGGYTRTYCTSRSHQSMKCDGKKCERGYYRLRVNSVGPSQAPKDVWTLTNSHLYHSSTTPSHPFFKTICPWGAYATQPSNTNSTACAQNNPICSTGAMEEWAKKGTTKNQGWLPRWKVLLHAHTHTFPGYLISLQTVVIVAHSLAVTMWWRTPTIWH